MVALAGLVSCSSPSWAVNPDPALVTVTVELTEEGKTVGHQMGLVTVGQVLQVRMRSPDDAAIDLAFRVEHVSARQGTFTIRAVYSRDGQVILAPVFAASPGELVRMEIDVDERRQVLSVSVSPAN